MEVWLASVESLDANKYRLGLYAELSGPKEFLEAARDAVEDHVSEQVEAAAAEAGEATLLEKRPPRRSSSERWRKTMRGHSS